MSDPTNSSTGLGQAPLGAASVTDESANLESSALDTTNEPQAGTTDGAAVSPASTQDVIATHATTPEQAAAIQALASSTKSLAGSTVLGERAASQSPEAKIGALTALKAAETNHGHKFRDAVQAFGDTVASAIKGELAILHGLDTGKVADVKAVLTPPQNDITS